MNRNNNNVNKLQYNQNAKQDNVIDEDINDELLEYINSIDLDYFYPNVESDYIYYYCSICQI